jgi:hypothetical protein
MDVDVGPVIFPPVNLPQRLGFFWLQLDLKNHNEYDFVSEFLIDIRQPVIPGYSDLRLEASVTAGARNRDNGAHLDQCGTRH